MAINHFKNFILFALILLISCEKDEVSNDITVQVVNQLTDNGKQYDIRLIAVSEYEEFNFEITNGELVKHGETSKKFILNGDGAETVYSDTWTLHFAYKNSKDSIWFYGGTSPAEEIRHQTLKKGDNNIIYLRTAELVSHEDISGYQNREYALIAFKNKLWLTGGTDYSVPLTGKTIFRNEVYNSFDGINWRFATTNKNPWQERQDHELVVFNNKIWILGGTIFKENTQPGVSINDIWASENGVDWELISENAPWAKRSFAKCVVFKNKLWLIGGYPYFTNHNGYFNDVWSTTDGENWTLETGNAPWPASFNKIIVYDNKLWSINEVKTWEGITANEVWNSDNGKDWEQITDSIPFTPLLHSFETVAFEDKIWILGGSYKGDDGYTHQTNSSWYSINGQDWELANSNCLPEPINPHSTVVFQNKIWQIEYTSSRIRIENSSDGINWSVVE